VSLKQDQQRRKVNQMYNKPADPIRQMESAMDVLNSTMRATEYEIGDRHQWPAAELGRLLDDQRPIDQRRKRS
jgi:hypothetical protein